MGASGSTLRGWGVAIALIGAASVSAAFAFPAVAPTLRHLAVMSGVPLFIGGGAIFLHGRQRRASEIAWETRDAIVEWRVPRDRYLDWHGARGSDATGIALRLQLGLFFGALAIGALWVFRHGEPWHAVSIGVPLFLAFSPIGPVVRRLLTPPLWPGHGAVPLKVDTDGAWLGGAIVRWRAPGLRFVDAAVRDAPPTLVVRYATRVKRGEALHTVQIPVPDAAIADAEVLRALIDPPRSPQIG